MSKRFLKRIIIIVIVLAMGGYETYACVVQGKEPFWKNYPEKKLDLKIDYAGYYNKVADGHPNAGSWAQRNLTTQKFFNFNDVKPGDFGEGTIGLHLKNQDAWGCVIIKPTENDDKISLEPELLEVGEEIEDLGNIWDGELAQNLNFKVWADMCAKKKVKPGDNIYQPDCDKLLTSGTGPFGEDSGVKLVLADSENLNIFNEKNKPLKKNKNYYIGVEWEVPNSVGNIVQTDTYAADITFYVEQSEGNESFRCADIREDEPNKCENGATRDCYSGSSDTNNAGLCQGGIQTCSNGKWGRCAGEILPEREICKDKLDNDCDGKKDEKDCVLSSCDKDSQCDDGNEKTIDSCVAGACKYEKKNKL